MADDCCYDGCVVGLLAADVTEGLPMIPGMNHPDGMMGWWMGGWGWLWLILLSAALIAVVVWALTRSGRGGSSLPDRTEIDALHILEERFARGEIDQDEFERRRAALRNDDG